MSDFEPVSDIDGSASDDQAVTDAGAAAIRDEANRLSLAKTRRDELLARKAQLESAVLDAQLKAREREEKPDSVAPGIPAVSIPHYGPTAQLLGVFPLTNWDERLSYIRKFMPDIDVEDVHHTYDSRRHQWTYKFTVVAPLVFKAPVVLVIGSDNKIVLTDVDLAGVGAVAPKVAHTIRERYVSRARVNLVMWALNLVATELAQRILTFRALALSPLVAPKPYPEASKYDNLVVYALLKSKSLMSFDVTTSDPPTTHQVTLLWQTRIGDTVTGDSVRDLSLLVVQKDTNVYLAGANELFAASLEKHDNVVDAVANVVEQLFSVKLLES